MIDVGIGIIFACIGLGAIAWAVAGCIDLRDSWRHARAVMKQTQAELSDQPVPYWPAWPDDALLRLLREAGCADFEEHAEGALRIVGRKAWDWDEALERPVRQEGTEQ